MRPFPGPGGAAQVSTEGGTAPLWSRDGRELYYRDGVNLIAASMSAGTVRSRTVLFEDNYQTSNATNYDVLPDGRFVMLRGVGAEERPLVVMMNWLTELRRLTSTTR